MLRPKAIAKVRSSQRIGETTETPTRQLEIPDLLVRPLQHSGADRLLGFDPQRNEQE